MPGNKIGERIKDLRIKRGLSQRALGELCDPKMDAGHIRKIESGKVSPTAETLLRLQNALQTAISQEYFDNSPLIQFKDTYEYTITDTDKYTRFSILKDEYTRFSILKKACKRLNVDCYRHEHSFYDVEAKSLGLEEIEYTINGNVTITEKELEIMFDRFIEHIAIEIKALIFEEGVNDGK